MIRVFTLLISIIPLSCVSLTGDDRADKPPLLNASLPLEKIVDASINYGGKTLNDGKDLIRRLNKEKEAALLVQLSIANHYRQWDRPQLVNAVNIYQATQPEKPEETFDLLIQSERKLARDLSWYIAGTFSTKTMGAAIDRHLTVAIEKNDIDEILSSPQFPSAVAANQLKGLYSLLRLGLFRTNSDSFASAMIALNSKQATADFLEYLAQAPVDELRQLTMVKLNVFTCIRALNHMVAVPPKISHPRFEHLFYFAISRNTTLSELSRRLIMSYLPNHAALVARHLARLDNWVQIAFIEGSRRNMTPVLGGMFSELRKQSSAKDVIEEIDAIRI
ncbi:MAG: hypothetical protein R3B45_06970 [Bdellovibrionota bacterium]